MRINPWLAGKLAGGQACSTSSGPGCLGNSECDGTMCALPPPGMVCN